MARGWATPCVMSPDGNPTNFHMTADNHLVDRVTGETATHLIVVAIPGKGKVWPDVVSINQFRRA